MEVKDVRLPLQLQRAMAAEAEAAREARAKVISAEGEMKASEALKNASDIITTSPAALQLRYLQTLVRSEKMGFLWTAAACLKTIFFSDTHFGGEEFNDRVPAAH